MELPLYVKELLKKSSLKSSRFTAKMEDETPPLKYTFWQPWLDKDDSSKQGSTKQLPTTKWKRDRRTRNEYSRKSDPKIPENFSQDLPSSPENSNSFQQSSNGYTNHNVTASNGQNKSTADTPLDMSVRQRGQPPSYSQTINNPGYRSSYRPSVITQNTAPSPRDDLPSGISMCDPIIDEHFRRSLGKDYVAIFSNNNVPREANPVKPPSRDSSSVIELMDSTGLSVDDHFAKALGDTWLKLNKKDNEIKNNSSENVVTLSF